MWHGGALLRLGDQTARVQTQLCLLLCDLPQVAKFWDTHVFVSVYLFSGVKIVPHKIVLCIKWHKSHKALGSKFNNIDDNYYQDVY